jgi:hypothetical protein
LLHRRGLLSGTKFNYQRENLKAWSKLTQIQGIYRSNGEEVGKTDDVSAALLRKQTRSGNAKRVDLKQSQMLMSLQEVKALQFSRISGSPNPAVAFFNFPTHLHPTASTSEMLIPELNAQ